MADYLEKTKLHLLKKKTELSNSHAEIIKKLEEADKQEKKNLWSAI